MRSEKCGTRLKNVKRNGGLTTGYATDWAKGAYKLVSTEGLLTKIVHNATTDSIDIDASYALGVTWVLINNWSDWDAALVKPPMAAVKLNQFFKSASHGPFVVRNFGCKQAEFAKTIDSESQSWESERQQRMTTSSTNVAVAKDGLADIKNEKAQANLKRARDKAQITLQQKRAKAEIKFNRAAAGVRAALWRMSRVIGHALLHRDCLGGLLHRVPVRWGLGVVRAGLLGCIRPLFVCASVFTCALKCACGVCARGWPWPEAVMAFGATTCEASPGLAWNWVVASGRRAA